MEHASPPGTSVTSEATGRNNSTNSEGIRRYVEWSNERHISFLRNMEATFVEQLYKNNPNLLGRSFQGGQGQASDAQFSGESGINACVSPGQQHKVLRGGCWENRNFEGEGAQTLEKPDGSRVLLANQWIRHYKSANRHEVEISPALQKQFDFENRVICAKGKLSVLSPSANSKQFHASQMYRRNSVGTDAEASGQNFDRGDIEGDKEDCACSPKRQKIGVDATPDHDQVVPFGNFAATREPRTNSPCLEGERHDDSDL